MSQPRTLNTRQYEQKKTEKKLKFCLYTIQKRGTNSRDTKQWLLQKLKEIQTQGNKTINCYRDKQLKATYTLMNSSTRTNKHIYTLENHL